MVSIILPIYHGEKYVKKAINSIKNQSYHNFELIIVDDCSIDASISIVKETLSNVDFPWRIIKNKVNKGIAFSYNEALSIAKGDYVSLLDEDDYYDPDKLLRQTCFLDDNPNYVAVGGKVIVVDENENIISTNRYACLDKNMIKATLLFENCFCNGEVMFRKSVIDAEEIRYKEYGFGLDDMGFWMKLSKKGDIYYLKDHLYYHRIHGDNYTSFCRKQEKENRKDTYKRIMTESLRDSELMLSDRTISIITEVLTEDKKRMKLDVKESKVLIEAYNEIINNARRKGISYVKEIEAYFDRKITK